MRSSGPGGPIKALSRQLIANDVSTVACASAINGNDSAKVVLGCGHTSSYLSHTCRHAGKCGSASRMSTGPAGVWSSAFSTSIRISRPTRFSDAAGNARQKVSDTAGKAQDVVSGASRNLETTIEHNPLSAVLIALIAGLFIGIFGGSLSRK